MVRSLPLKVLDCIFCLARSQVLCSSLTCMVSPHNYSAWFPYSSFHFLSLSILDLSLPCITLFPSLFLLFLPHPPSLLSLHTSLLLAGEWSVPHLWVQFRFFSWWNSSCSQHLGWNVSEVGSQWELSVSSQKQAWPRSSATSLQSRCNVRYGFSHLMFTRNFSVLFMHHVPFPLDVIDHCKAWPCLNGVTCVSTDFFLYLCVHRFVDWN